MGRHLGFDALGRDSGSGEWKTVAWNGVCFEAPADWEPARIGRRHLMLEAAPGPVMEIKWAAVTGRFSDRSQLRTLGGRVTRRGAAFRKTALPEDWRAAVKGFDAQGFQWDAGDERAMGALLYCRGCRTASLVQFLERPAAASIARDAVRVLASLRDHRSDDRVAWALYDIAALLPARFTLDRHRFDAGRFVVEFKGPGRRLTLYRWAPAEVLLQNRSLADFAGAVAGDTRLRFRPLAGVAHPAVEGCPPPPAGPVGRLRLRLGMTWFCRLRLWHVASRNRILGMRLEGRRPIDGLEMQTVSEGYAMAGERPFGLGADPQ
jgi:hypothetical protein